MLKLLVDKFWNEDVWLPPNTTWADLTPGPDKEVVYTDYRHVFIPIPLAVVLIAIRYVLDKYLFEPFGKYLGIKDTRPRKAPNNPKLEAAYKANPKHNQLCGLAKQLDMSERQVQRWWRLRRSQDKPSTLVKFCEDMWRGTFYFNAFSFGLYVMWDKDWLWDIDYCYIGYPHQGITDDIWWYYMITSAYYWSLTISQFWDVKRIDFWQTFVHHFAAIALIAFSWITNLHRAGTLVILSHDVSEIFLEAAKAAKYAKYQRVCDVMFAMFTVIWIITRLGIYPFYVMWGTLIRFPMLLPAFPVYYMINVLLCLLLMLHLVWTWLILQVVYKSIIAGKMEKDIRSSSSESELSDSSHQSYNESQNRK